MHPNLYRSPNNLNIGSSVYYKIWERGAVLFNLLIVFFFHVSCGTLSIDLENRNDAAIPIEDFVQSDLLYESDLLSNTTNQMRSTGNENIFYINTLSNSKKLMYYILFYNFL